MTVSIHVKFEGFRVNRAGSAGSAIISFSLWERIDGQKDRFLAELPLPTSLTDGGIPGMIAAAAQHMAHNFRTMAEEAQTISEHYQASVSPLA